MYKRINKLKEKCRNALEQIENTEADDKDLPQSYRDHIELTGGTSPPANNRLGHQFLSNSLFHHENDEA